MTYFQFWFDGIFPLHGYFLEGRKGVLRVSVCALFNRSRFQNTNQSIICYCRANWHWNSSRSICEVRRQDVLWEGLAHSLRSISSQSCPIGLRSRLPVKFFYTKPSHPCLYGHCFVHWCALLLEQEWAIPKQFPQIRENEIVQNASVRWRIKSSFLCD